MSDSVIGEWNLHSTDAGACASAVFLPAVRTRQQSKSLAAEDNQVTDNRKRKHGFSVPKPRLFQAAALTVSSHLEKSFRDADKKVRLFPPTEIS